MGMTDGQPTWPPPPEVMKTYDAAMKKVAGESDQAEKAEELMSEAS